MFILTQKNKSISKKKFGAVSNYKRPKKISENSTSMYETINYFIKKYNINKKFDYLVLLQPTSPLRNTFDINRAYQNDD